MKKYRELLRVTIDQYFVYRLNFTLWRFRVVLNIILIYFLWSAIYLQNRNIFGYSKEMMLTYVLLTSFLSDFVFSSKIHEIGAEILQGDIINKILKPVSFLKYVITREIADKIVNVSFSIVEIALMIIILKPHLVPPHDALSVLIAVLMILIGLTIAFFVSFSISMMAFWTAEIWAPRFIYIVMVTMLAGNYFPLDILPGPIYLFLLLTPFPYFIFLPTQIYLKGISGLFGFEVFMSIVWIVIFYFLTKFLWNKGMKEYNFYGR